MLRILTVMDEFTREGLAIDVDTTTSAERVIGVLTQLVAEHGAPEGCLALWKSVAATDESLADGTWAIDYA